MVGINTRRRFASIVQYKRKMIHLDQKTFGSLIWPDIPPGTAQSRISRIERGNLWPETDVMLRIIERLNIWDDILDPQKMAGVEGFLVVDQACDKFIPDFPELLKMMSAYAVKNDHKKFYAVVRLLFELATSQEEKFKSE